MNLNRIVRALSQPQPVSYATVWLTVLFLFVFLVGCFIGSIDPLKELNTLQATMLGIILAILSSIVANLTKFLINEEARKLASDKISEQKEVIANKDNLINNLETTNQRILTLILRVKEFISESENQSEEKDLEQLRRQVMDNILAIEKEEEVARNLADWLEIDSNRTTLMKHAVNEAATNFDIKDLSKETVKLFKRDIFACIQWLHTSVKERAAYRVKVNKLAQSANLFSNGLENHKNALRAIELHPYIYELTKDTKMFSEFINILIYHLESEVKTTDILPKVSYLRRN